MLIQQADALHLPFADQSVDLVFGSPPYCDARTYKESMRVCRGPVLWVVAGVTRSRNYQPAPEGLMWEWWKVGGDCQLYRPCAFVKANCGIPGSGGKDWFRSDWEYVLCFKRPGPLPWSDNTAMGHPPKWAPGGEMSNRLSSGERVNQWGRIGGRGPRNADGSTQKTFRPSHRQAAKTNDDEVTQGYLPPAKANPGNVVSCMVGGGHMGSRLAHENEAPFPEKLAEFFVLSLCPPGGTVLDPFSGSGTTAAVAVKTGRQFIATDIRESQCELTRRRIADL
jgi:hypothetical protein